MFTVLVRRGRCYEFLGRTGDAGADYYAALEYAAKNSCLEDGNIDYSLEEVKEFLAGLESQPSRTAAQPKAAPQGEARFCDECGAELESGAAFCAECGAQTN